ncbi:two-component regulator propeller domain-containing protein [Lacibacter sp.]|uniref:type IX secretion system anionic LPS delivery protein PorZ n=1 Tax=Lacibacter sp. TaxID=1915409 RepID=UPI002B4ACDB5|nr:two-component regulator propeller domain-containing protein [Lacibacter sp.]HLP37387.1 two-component regulator propeller domain-containing protein [Lacibacter sp.]
MKYSVVCFFLLLFCCSKLLAQLAPIGQWREHMDYRSGKRVALAADKVYVATNFGAYSVGREDGEITRISKVSGLNDVGVRTLNYYTAGEKLLIAYNNSNLDVLYRNDVINIPDILRSTVTGDKTIYNISFHNNKAYLSTGLGVIVVDLQKYEISNTFIIGNNGANVKVNGFAADATRFYAATEEGLKVADLNATNLNDYRSWTTVSGTNGLPAGAVQQVFTINSTIVLQCFNTIYVNNALNWQAIYNDAWRWESVNVSDAAILISEERFGWIERRVLSISTSGVVNTTVQNNNELRYPFHAVKSGTEIWIADFEKGLVKAEGSLFERYAINSPYGPLDGEMSFFNNKLYVAGGSINDAWNYQFNGTGFFTFDGNEWKDYNRSNLSFMDTVFDVISITVDPRDETIYAGSFGGGLVEFKSATQYKIYKQNSPLNVTVGDPNNYRVGGMAFDAANNLWISNFGGSNNFLVKKADGNWQQFRVPFLIQDNMVGAVLIDDADQKWIKVPQGNGLFVYNHGASIESTGDDRWKWFQTGRGSGNLPSNAVNCMVKDKDGFIWLGTDKGIAIIQCPGEVFTTNGCEAFQPVVQQDNFAGFLFENEDVRAIAVDAANRKWVGTRNGVWLISADGEKVLERFTTENSPLLSNAIIRIAIDPKTGEVYFSTFNGICSYRAGATEASENPDKVIVFPSPVPPGYNGSIGIRGLPENSIVKIVELNGRLVYQTRSLGGQAVWNGRDYRNQRVSSGVYMVLAKDEFGAEKQVGKIVFIK